MTEVSVSGLKADLKKFADGIDRDPQTNSVFLLAKSLFQDLEQEPERLNGLRGVIDELHLSNVTERLERFSAQHGSSGDQWHKVIERLNGLAASGFEAYSAAVSQPRGGIVFTAHPTFALSQDFRQTMANAVSSGSPDGLKRAVELEGPDQERRLDLACEHEQVQTALKNAQAALSKLAGLIFSVAQQAFPGDWKRLRPSLPTLASWVGYDLDGRTDIEWYNSLAFRLSEKAVQLGRYKERLEQLGLSSLTDLIEKLSRSQVLAQNQAQAFIDVDSPTAMAEAANLLTEAPDNTSIRDASEILTVLERVLERPDTSDEVATELLVLISEIDALQLGTGRIHLRLNSAQIRTLIQKDLGLETERAELGRIALTALAERAGDGEVRPVNFADLAAEPSTARRQFMLCAQLLKHVDAGSPIRFLIAESENPATVMGALYLARQYGIAEKLDISPLFETPEAMETGGRFVERLLEQPEFAEYLKDRGYLSLQFGFSDSGRFVGQIAGDLAIERIHSHVGRALANKPDLDVGLLLFNTHGESMGRGAFPGTFEERFDHLLTPWNRARFKASGVPHMHEASFQGGDGFLHFMTPELAETTLASFYLHLTEEPDDGSDDAFYQQTDFIWDVYRSLGDWQVFLFQQGDYGRVLGGMAGGFLLKAGSRVRRRAGGEAGPRSLRAISHNATLQQLGLPVNTACGLGSAVRTETDRLVDIANKSKRLSRLVALAVRARILLSLPAFRGYGALADPSAWMAFSRGSDPSNARVYRKVAQVFEDFEHFTSFAGVANRVAIDVAKFDQLISQLDEAPSIAERHAYREELHILHAIRQALIMHALALAARIPPLSNRHALSVDDLIEMIGQLQFTDTIEALCMIFPLEGSSDDLRKNISEEGYSQTSEGGYTEIHATIISPLKEILELMHRLTLAICQKYGAYG